MAFSATFTDYITKARDATFKDRLRVALMKQSRYFIEADAAGLGYTQTHMDAVQDYSRRIRYLIWSDPWLHSAALHLLWSVGAENVDSDADLDALVTSKYLELPESALAA